MADMENKPVDEEMKIPVFTVLKNGNILKNIILNYPTPSPQSELLQKSATDSEKCDQEGGKLLVGRHPDCDIVLDHLSISRFHLRICLQPSLQKISVIDLSSVHGTWVSEQKIKPQVAVELNEGNILRLGASTRIYKLQWVPFSQVFKIENPMNSSAPIPEEEEEACQDENCAPPEKNQDDLWATQIPLAPPMPESMNSSNPFEVSSVSNYVPVKNENPELEETSSSFFPQSHLERENQIPPKREQEEKVSLLEPPHLEESAGSSMPLKVLLASDALLGVEHCSPESCFTGEVLSEGENENQSRQTRSGEHDMSSLGLRRGKHVRFLHVHAGKEGCSDAGIEAEDQKEDMYIQAENHKENVLVEQNKREEENQKDVLGLLGASQTEESVGSSMPLRVLFTSNAQLESENCSPKAHFTTEVPSEGENGSWMVRSGQRDASNLWSRRGKSAYSIRIQTGRKVSSDAGMEAENQKEIMHDEQEKGYENALCKVLFHEDHEDNESILSDKENMTPQVPSNLKLKEGKPQIQQPESLKSSSKVIVTNSDVEETLFPEDKENMTPNFSYEMRLKKPFSENQRRTKPEMILMRKAERVPFQSLKANSSNSKSSISVPNAATSKNSNSVNHTYITKDINCSSSNNYVDQAVINVGESKRKWYMVVDTSCLLNEESRRSLKLLEGLKGTHLLIPRMVIRELDCLSRRGSWFKKVNEASSVLQWIEACMMKTSWWIHVQSSMEGMPIAPTPPASPRSRLSGGSNEFGTANSVPFSTCGSLMEIISPTAEDHILECALFFKRIKNDGQLVLLTNDTALKIKAMAEGLICETAMEFRGSLVNPYSERFLWVESTPIGPTWSCVGDTGMNENYHYCPPVRKTAKAAEVAKGLKLILLHNSHYGQVDPVK